MRRARDVIGALLVFASVALVVSVLLGLNATATVAASVVIVCGLGAWLHLDGVDARRLS